MDFSESERVRAFRAPGTTDDTPLAFRYAHERAGRIHGGADEVHLTTVAQRVPRRYAARAREAR